MPAEHAVDYFVRWQVSNLAMLIEGLNREAESKDLAAAVRCLHEASGWLNAYGKAVDDKYREARGITGMTDAWVSQPRRGYVT